MDEEVIVVENLKKIFKSGIRMKKFVSLRGISFSVRKGECYGFLGPNGAGKTTTIKILTGLIRPTEGKVLVMGRPPGDLSVKKNIGYLPEHPYFYDYLKPEELLNIFGLLFSLNKNERKNKINEVLEITGLKDAKDRTLRKYSKGMLQRFGIAQSLINDPEIFILDEPLSGLDPIGRKEMRDLIGELKKRKKTIFFSSHILTDIEMLCDRVSIIHKGNIIKSGSLNELLESKCLTTEIICRIDGKKSLDEHFPEAQEINITGDLIKILVEEEKTEEVIKKLLSMGAKISLLTNRRETLEELIVREAIRIG